ncbi:NADP-dependent oxidoreductase domain [Dillenia turbinata]|uniref:NADP-dependent oxidoreductase domain n=1 Tax=Dillenia turbinata TaxID=194707 RepID=A0AAN8ZG97_9MAGN
MQDEQICDPCSGTHWCASYGILNLVYQPSEFFTGFNFTFQPPKFPRFHSPFWPWQKVKMEPQSVSPTVFETWAWGNQLLRGYEESMNAELQRAFNLAVENSINLFDTVDSYGTGRLNGQSEKLLAKFIRQFQGNNQARDHIVIATKLAAYPWHMGSLSMLANILASTFSLIAYLEYVSDNLSELLWEKRDLTLITGNSLLFLYNPFLFFISFPYYVTFVAFFFLGLLPVNGSTMKMSLVRAVGVSNYGPKQLIKIYNYYLNAQGVPLFSVRALLFSQILLGLEPLLSAVEEISQKRGKTIPQVAIFWCICQGTIPMPGVKSAKQEENLGALGWRLSSDELLQLEYAAHESPGKMIQNNQNFSDEESPMLQFHGGRVCLQH